MSKYGYTGTFKNMLDNANIHIHIMLNTDYKEILDKMILKS